MIRDSVARAASFSQFVAASLLALVGVRFGAHGVLLAVRQSAPTFQSSSTPPPTPPPQPSAAPSAASSAALGVKLGSTLRIPIVVNSPRPRAEVRIDGILVGNTPYVGEVTCKAGEKIQIEVTPGKRHEGTCALGTMRVEAEK